MAKATSGTKSGTGGAVSGTGADGGTGETVGAVGARGGMGGPDGRVWARVASRAAKDSLAALPKEEVIALLHGDLRLAKPAFLRRLMDGTVSFLITNRRCTNRCCDVCCCLCRASYGPVTLYGMYPPLPLF